MGACWLRGPGVPPLPGLRASSFPPGPGYESDDEGGLCKIHKDIHLIIFIPKIHVLCTFWKIIGDRRFRKAT